MPDKFASTKHAEPYVFTELELAIAPGLLLAADNAVPVLVEFSYSAGQAARDFGHPDNQDDGVPPELELATVKLTESAFFTSDRKPEQFGIRDFVLSGFAGADLLPLLSAVDRSTLEDAMLARVARKN
jgi:hypothetical protein